MSFSKCSLTLGTASLLALSAAGCRDSQHATPAPVEPVKPVAHLEQLSPELGVLVPAGADLEKLADGYTWTEGPVWTQPGVLLFADIPSNSIREMTPDGKVTIWLQPSGYQGKTPYAGKEPGTNGMTLDDSMRLTVAGHGARSIIRFETMDPKGKKTILADSYQGKPLNSPNDLVYGPDGSLYFTDPPYGLPTQQDNDPLKKLKVNGVYRIPNAMTAKPGSAPNRSKLQLLISDLPRPNGIAISPDNKWLYVADSQQKELMRYPLKTDGSIGEGTVFLDTSSAQGTGTTDGLKLDSKGNLYTTGPGGVWIVTPEGKHLGTILTDKPTANVAWGGEDGTTLYLTNSDAIYRIKLNIPGYRPWIH